MKLKKILKKMIYTFFMVVAVLGIGAIIVLNLPSFGKNPSGKRLERILKSANYRDGKFQNLEETPDLSSDKSFTQMLYEWFFPNVKDLKPTKEIPSVKTDLKNLPNNSMVWVGHSSYLLKINEKTILIDPVFNSASPFSFMVKPFEMSYNYSAKDLPEVIDLLVITHDHYDHLDYGVMKDIQPKVGKILTSLGVGSHLEYWEFSPEIITELDWNEEAQLIGMKFTSLPTRHFSGRGLKRNQTLWGSFLLDNQGFKLYIGGDSGYGKHIADIGKRFPDIDLALMENGQYNEDWRYIHFLPEDLRKAMKEIGAKRYFAGHNSKFALGKHAWYEPQANAQKFAKEDSLNIITPKIGEIVLLNSENQEFEKWWE